MNCRFCTLKEDEAGRILNETEYTLTVLSNPRLMIGHTLVIPKRHVEKLSELSKEEREAVFQEVMRVEEKLLANGAGGCDITQHYRPFIPENALKVNHLHFHVRPRELDDELYAKSQIFERDIFQHISDEEVVKYKQVL